MTTAQTEVASDSGNVGVERQHQSARREARREQPPSPEVEAIARPNHPPQEEEQTFGRAPRPRVGEEVAKAVGEGLFALEEPAQLANEPGGGVRVVHILRSGPSRHRSAQATVAPPKRPNPAQKAGQVVLSLEAVDKAFERRQ